MGVGVSVSASCVCVNVCECVCVNVAAGAEGWRVRVLGDVSRDSRRQQPAASVAIFKPSRANSVNNPARIPRTLGCMAWLSFAPARIGGNQHDTSAHSSTAALAALQHVSKGLGTAESARTGRNRQGGEQDSKHGCQDIHPDLHPIPGALFFLFCVGHAGNEQCMVFVVAIFPVLFDLWGHFSFTRVQRALFFVATLPHTLSARV